MNKLILITTLMAINMSQADNSITIYSGNHQGHLNQDQLQNIHNISGFAVVKQIKTAPFESGTFSLAFDDVAAHIDPTTVSFNLPENPNAVAVLDQNFQFDLVSSEKLLQKYLDQKITVNHNLGDKNISTMGTLLSTTGGLTLQTANNQITTIQAWNQIQFPELPGGLLTKPTLVWLLDSQTSDKETIELTYQTKGMTWWSDYIINLKETGNACTLDMTSWVTIVNKSGASFPKTKLKLIAGDINRVQENTRNNRVRESFAMSADNQFSEQSLFEYHLYKLPRKIDLPNNSTKQVQLLQNTQGIQCNKTLEFNGSQQHSINYHRPITEKNHLTNSDAKVQVFLSFNNSTQNKLGIPLPSGRVRVNTIDQSEDSLEFIGEDSIDHTASNKLITLKLGNSFDVTGNRKQNHFELGKNSMTEQFEITIDNQKDDAQQVAINEPLYRWSNWTITQHNADYTQTSSSMIAFTINVPAKSSKTITYTVQYQWPDNQKIR